MTEPDTIVYRRVTDPAQIGMRAEPNNRFYAPGAPWRRLRRRGADCWLWQSDDGAEGTVGSRSEGLTMIAIHSPDLRHLVEPD